MKSSFVPDIEIKELETLELSKRSQITGENNSICLNLNGLRKDSKKAEFPASSLKMMVCYCVILDIDNYHAEYSTALIAELNKRFYKSYSKLISLENRNQLKSIEELKNLSEMEGTNES